MCVQYWTWNFLPHGDSFCESAWQVAATHAPLQAVHTPHRLLSGCTSGHALAMTIREGRKEKEHWWLLVLNLFWQVPLEFLAPILKEPESLETTLFQNVILVILMIDFMLSTARGVTSDETWSNMILVWLTLRDNNPLARQWIWKGFNAVSRHIFISSSPATYRNYGSPCLPMLLLFANVVFSRIQESLSHGRQPVRIYNVGKVTLRRVGWPAGWRNMWLHTANQVSLAAGWAADMANSSYSSFQHDGGPGFLCDFASISFYFGQYCWRRLPKSQLWLAPVWCMNIVSSACCPKLRKYYSCVELFLLKGRLKCRQVLVYKDAPVKLCGAAEAGPPWK